MLDVPGFLPYVSGYKNMMLLAELAGKIGREEVRAVITRVGLDSLKKGSAPVPSG